MQKIEWEKERESEWDRDRHTERETESVREREDPKIGKITFSASLDLSSFLCENDRSKRFCANEMGSEKMRVCDWVSVGYNCVKDFLIRLLWVHTMVHRYNSFTSNFKQKTRYLGV